MNTFLATLTITLLLVAGLTSVNAQETNNAPKGQMPMMEGSMKCPMCGQMMPQGMMRQMPMMKGMMGGKDGMMGQKMEQKAEKPPQQKMPMMDSRQGVTEQTSANLPTPHACLAMADVLKLTDDQVIALKEITRNLEKETIRKLSDAAIARVELNALLDQQEIDTDQVQKKVRQIHELQAEQSIAQIQASVDATKILNAAQRTHLMELMKGNVPPVEETEKTPPESAEHEEHHK